jgi:hypothetical protein
MKKIILSLLIVITLLGCCGTNEGKNDVPQSMEVVEYLNLKLYGDCFILKDKKTNCEYFFYSRYEGGSCIIKLER